MVLEAGHTLGNHSFSHACLPKLEASALSEQISEDQHRARQPEQERAGAVSSALRCAQRSRARRRQAAGMRTVLWNIDSQDWADPVPSYIAQRVLADIERE